MKTLFTVPRFAKLALPVLCLAAISSPVWAQSELKVTLAIPGDAAGINGQGDEIELMTQAVIDDYNNANPTLPAITLQVIDSKTTDEKTLLQDAAGSIALLSCSSTKDCLVQANIAKTLQIPLIGPMSGDAAMRDPAANYVFPVRPSNKETLQEALHAISGMRVKNLGVLVQNNYYGKSADAELSAIALPKDLTIAAKENIATDSNWETITRKLQSAGVTAVLILSDDITTTSNLVQYWKSNRKTAKAYTPTLIHLNHLARPDYAEKINGYPAGALFITIVPSPWAGKRQVQRDYQQLAQTRGIYRANYESFEAFINASVLVRAIKDSKATTPAKLAQYLRSTPINLGGMTVRHSGPKIGTGILDQAVLGLDGAFRH